MIYTKIYEKPPINDKEILRYALAKEEESVRALLEKAKEQGENKLSYRVCYREFDIGEGEEVLKISSSKNLQKNLASCCGFVIFAATVGAEIDRAIAKEAKSSPSMALMLNAFATERIESLCDLFCQELAEQKAKENLVTKPRISPGYGDISLSLQKDIFRYLDCPRKIGLTLGDNLLMTPRKSVTAIVGIQKADII